MKIRWLSKTEKDSFNANVALIVDFNDVALATTGVAVQSLPVLAGSRVQVVGFKVPTAFDLPTAGDLTLSVGDGGSPTVLMPAVVVALDGAIVRYAVGGLPKVYLVDDTVDLFWSATSMAYTSGQAVVYLAVDDLNAWPAA